MAHEVESLFSVREIPWHGLGIILTENPQTAEDAIVCAGLDWPVEQRPLFFPHESGDMIEVPRNVANVRVNSDGTEQVLGVVGNKYLPIQNTEAFGFFDSIIQAGEAVYETAGSLRHGRKIWVLAKNTLAADVVPGDTVESYMLFSNSHDGTSAIQVKPTNIRVCCNNTLTAALGRGANINVRHTASAKDTLEIARRILQQSAQNFANSIESFQAMARVQMNKERLDAYVEDLFPPNKDGEVSTRTQNIRNGVVSLFESGRGNGMSGVRGTAWAAYNAVTEYVDHVRGTSSEKRLESAWFGPGEKLKSAAFESAMALAA